MNKIWTTQTITCLQGFILFKALVPSLQIGSILFAACLLCEKQKAQIGLKDNQKNIS